MAVLRCLTLAGLAVRSGDEAHVTFTAEASGQVQTVAALTQVAVLCTFIAVCNVDHTQSVNPKCIHEPFNEQKCCAGYGFLRV